MYLEPFEETLEYLMAGAQEAMAQGGSFVPFGAGVRPDGERVHLDLDPATAKDARQAVALLVEGLRVDAEERGLVIAGIAFDGRIQLEGAEGPVSAIVAHVERRGGASMDIVRPYVRAPDANLTYHPDVRRDVDPEIFASR